MAEQGVSILSLGEMGPGITESLVADGFVVHAAPARPLPEILAAHGAQIRGVMTRGAVPVDAALLEKLPALEMVANFGVGYDSVDVAAAAARGVAVSNTPDVLNDEVADLAVGLLLATIRRLPQADRHARGGHWEKGAFALSGTLRGRTVGLLGMGRIGQAIARRLSAFDVPVVYHARRPVEGVTWRHFPTLVGMAEAVDTLVAIVPGGAATRHLINAEVLAALGPNGVVVNVARGSVMDEDALIAALQAGRLHAAGLDVFADEPRIRPELLALENVVVVPHVGSATHHTRGQMAALVAENVRSWFAGRGLVTPVPA